MHLADKHATVSFDDRQEPAVIRVTGDIDSFCASQVRERFADAVGAGAVLVDIREVRFVDSAGLGALVGGIRRVREAGGAVAMCCTRPNVRRLISMTGFDRIVVVASTPAKARAAIASQTGSRAGVG